MVNFIDTHAHIYKEYYESIDDVIEKIKNVGIMRVINSACDIDSIKEVLEISNNNNSIYCTIGIHPENVDKYKEEDLLYIERNINNEKVVAIGEIGLDYHYTKENKNEQIKLFEKQLAIAEKYNLPVVVHSREATEDTINTLKKFNIRGVIHSFSGSYETAKIYEKMGYYLGVNGVVTFKNANIKEVIKKINLSNILLETDSPYLSPEPNRGKKNDPSNIIVIANYLCEILEIPLEKLSKITNENAHRIFDKMH